MTALIPATPAATPAPRDDVVLPGTADRIVNAIRPNTKRTYDTAWNLFAEWCATNDRQTLPASAATLADFTAHLCDLGRAPSTIENRIAVIRKQHRLAGHKGQPDTEAALLVLRGHKHNFADEGSQAKEAPPITRERLRVMSAACDPGTLAGKRDRLLLVLGFAVAARRSELAALRMSDLTIGADEFEVRFRSSKTDKDAKGAVRDVPRGEHVDTDPVGLLHEWLAVLVALGVDTTTGPLFRSVTTHGTLYRQQTGVRSDGVAYQYDGLTDRAVDGIVKRAARRAGIPNWRMFSGHSMRAGFATQAADDGVPQSLWEEHGRWKKGSPVSGNYVRRASRKRDNPLRRMKL